MTDKWKISRTVGPKIKTYRIKNDLTQEKLAEKAHISPTYLSALERGDKMPSLVTLINIVNELNITTDDLLVDVLKTKDTFANRKISQFLNDFPPDELERALAVLEALKKGKNK